MNRGKFVHCHEGDVTLVSQDHLSNTNILLCTELVANNIKFFGVLLCLWGGGGDIISSFILLFGQIFFEM